MHDITITIKADERLLALGEKILAAINTKTGKGIPPKPIADTHKETVVHTAAPKPVQSVPITAPTQSTPVVQPAPTAQPIPYTLEQLALAAAPLIDAGKGKELTDIVQGFGVVSLQQLPSEKYGEFATAIRGLGAQI